jgi:L-glutamine-phosphate cytidylyltransferase
MTIDRFSDAPRRVVVFAAGKGSRLGTLTEDRPKALLPLDDVATPTVLDRLLEQFLETGFQTVAVVGGYAFGVLTEHLERYAGRPVSTIYNGTYETVNNIGSLALAEEYLGRGGFISNVDIVLDNGIVEIAARSAEADPERSFLVVDPNVHVEAEEMKVAVDDAGRARAINKQLPVEDSIGEYIGLAYLSPADAPVVLEAARALLSRGETSLYYEDAIASVLDRMDLHVVSTDGLPWTEIDTVEDYERARRLVPSPMNASRAAGA